MVHSRDKLRRYRLSCFGKDIVIRFQEWYQDNKIGICGTIKSLLLTLPCNRVDSALPRGKSLHPEILSIPHPRPQNRQCRSIHVLRKRKRGFHTRRIQVWIPVEIETYIAGGDMDVDVSLLRCLRIRMSPFRIESSNERPKCFSNH